MGSYMGNKNQEFLVKAFSYLPENYVLYLNGNIQTGLSYVKKLQRIIKKKNIQNVKIGGFLKQNMLLKQLKKSDYFVSASLKEVQSLSVIEALAAGKPVIALKNETINELIDNKNGLKLPQNITPEKFAGEIKKYTEKNSKNYNQISKNCRKSVKRFDEEKVVQKLLATYREAIESQKKIKREKWEIEELIPKRFKKIFPAGFFIKKQKTIGLNISLFITIVLSILVSGIFSIIKWTKMNRD